MKHKAVFFDRDSTLTHADRALYGKRDALFLGWTGQPFIYGYDEMTSLFDEAHYPDAYFLAHRDDEEDCLREERAFWARYYECRLRRAGVSGPDIAQMAETLNSMMWLRGFEPYPETVRTLERFRARGLRMGVISDTSPSLRMTLVNAGLAGYFDSFVNSAWAGAFKPDKAIFDMALSSLGVTAEESLFVDDYVKEADGARDAGFTAFHILRAGLERGYTGEREWDIHSLWEMTQYEG